jgi:hypothetical protein
VRYIVLTLAVLGGLASAGLGYKWMSDAREVRPVLYAMLQNPDFANVASDPEVKPKLQELERLTTASYFLLAAGPLALAGGILAVTGRGNLAALFLLAAAAGPIVFTLKSLLTTSLLLIGGLLSFLVKPRAVKEFPS